MSTVPLVFAQIVYFGALAGERTIVITAETDDSCFGSAIDAGEPEFVTESPDEACQPGV